MNYYSLKTDDPTFQLAFVDIRTEWIDLSYIQNTKKETSYVDK